MARSLRNRVRKGWLLHSICGLTLLACAPEPSTNERWGADAQVSAPELSTQDAHLSRPSRQPDAGFGVNGSVTSDAKITVASGAAPDRAVTDSGSLNASDGDTPDAATPPMSQVEMPSDDAATDSPELDAASSSVAIPTFSDATPEDPVSEAPSADAGLPSTTLCPSHQIAGYDYTPTDPYWPATLSPGAFSINGRGYFVTLDSLAAPVLRYTRKLRFNVREGRLEDWPGHPILGYLPEGQEAGCLAQLEVPSATTAKATTLIRISANLDSAATPLPIPFSVNDPTATTMMPPASISVFDSKGDDHTIDVYLESRGNAVFAYHVLTSGDEVAPGTTEFVEIGSGELVFASGALSYEVNPPTCVTFFEAEEPQCFTIDFGPIVGEDGNSGLEWTTSLPLPSMVDRVTNDGSSGATRRLNIDAQGHVTAVFHDGKQLTLGTLAMANFTNEGGLQLRSDDGAFFETPSSGPPSLGAASDPEFGVLE